VIQSGHGTSFLLETLDASRIAREIVGQNLQGDVAIQPRVASTVHFAHSAGSDRRKDSVRPELVTCGKRHTK